MSSLVAQTVIHKYTTLVSGGMNAVLMNVIAFTFLSGLALGSLFSGSFIGRVTRPKLLWVLVDALVGVGCLGFLAFYSGIYRLSFDYFFGSESGMSLVTYYGYVLVLNLFTTFFLAFGMGMNFPIAFETLNRSSVGGASRIAVLILAVNTLGAATGALVSESILFHFSLSSALALSGGAYFLASFLVFLSPTSVESTKALVRPASTVSSRWANLEMFAIGLVGFSVQVFVLKLATSREPLSAFIYGRVVAQYLLLWAFGCGLANFVHWRTGRVFAGLGGSIVFGIFLVTFYDRAYPDFLILLPAFFTGWIYGQIYNETTSLTAMRAAILVCLNIVGCFVGGWLTGYVLPTYYSIAYALPVLGLLVSAVAFLNRKTVALALAGMMTLIVFTGTWVNREAPDKSFFRRLYQGSESELFDVREDWSGTGIVRGSEFLISGLSQTPNVRVPLGGYRSAQIFIPSIVKSLDRVAILGVAFGISNGYLAKLNPDTEFQNFDYFQALPEFWTKYSDLNFDLPSRPNAKNILQDGRLGLKMSRAKFNVIAEYANGEGIPGVSAIKSLEFYGLVKKKLSDGGVVLCIAGSQQVAGTLQKVFAHVYKLRSMPILIATDRPLEQILDFERAREILANDVLLREALVSTEVLLPLPDGFKLNLFSVDEISPEIRVVRDTDPVADYPTLMIPIRDNVESINDSKFIILKKVAE